MKDAPQFRTNQESLTQKQLEKSRNNVSRPVNKIEAAYYTMKGGQMNNYLDQSIVSESLNNKMQMNNISYADSSTLKGGLSTSMDTKQSQSLGRKDARSRLFKKCSKKQTISSQNNPYLNNASKDIDQQPINFMTKRITRSKDPFHKTVLSPPTNNPVRPSGLDVNDTFAKILASGRISTRMME